MAYGILSTGAYIPRLRLQRSAVAAAHGWFNAALRSLGKGERAMAAWDEDSVTMAVEAARDCLGARDRAQIEALRFASTTFPFLDRLNAGIVSEALSLEENLRASDSAASMRAGTSALMDALLGQGQTLVVAADKRPTLAASPFEMTSGDGAAALLVGEGTPIARLLGHATRTADFVDHYRTMENPADYQWEERWIRDCGYTTIVPGVIKAALAKAGVEASAVTRFIMPSTLNRVGPKAAGLPEACVADILMDVCGDTGAAHPLVLLSHALETAKTGEKILVVGFGQGADALLFEVTDENEKAPRGLGVSGHLARKREESNYTRFLTINDVISIERGMRAEADKQTAISALWRNRDAVTAFKGGICSQCGTRQFPKTRICVNPNCNAVDAQTPEPFAEKTGTVQSYTADRLTYSPDPPSCYGMISFAEGGRWMMDFTDVDEKDLSVGMAMTMMFRIKDYDPQRGFRRYFWKAAPSPKGV